MPTKRTRRTRGKVVHGIEARWLAGELPPDEPPNADTHDDGLGAVFFTPMPNKERHPHLAAWLAWLALYEQPDKRSGIA